MAMETSGIGNDSGVMSRLNNGNEFEMKSILSFVFGFFLCFLLTAVCFFALSTSGVNTTQIHFESESGNFKFVAMPEKGRDYKMMERQFEAYKQKEQVEEQVYRVSRKNYLNVFRWAEYRTVPEWRYPLK